MIQYVGPLDLCHMQKPSLMCTYHMHMCTQTHIGMYIQTGSVELAVALIFGTHGQPSCRPPNSVHMN